MMNGAAMNCRQDQVLHSLHRDSRGLQGAGYHLQMNSPCEQNFPAQHSKAMHSQSDHFVIDGSSQYLQSIPTIDTSRPARSEVRDPRSQVRWAQTRKPIDLPVPQFEIDMNYVGNNPVGTDDAYPNQNHKNLDLDTRIDLLIKSKALVGMHPIFSELDESADDSDDSFRTGPKIKGGKKHRPPSPYDHYLLHKNDDDPDKPLSRPPSPFLSRAKYLFWFNKAIELKEQAKAQEQELIEKATKKLLHDNVTSLNPNSSTSINRNHVDKSNRESKPFLKGLLNEISKEMKEIIKQQFIDDVLESTISDTLDSWWEKEQVKDEQQHSLISRQKLNSELEEQNKKTSENSLISEVIENVVSNLVRTASPKNSFSCEHEGFKHKEPFNPEDIRLDKTTDTNHTNSKVVISSDSLLSISPTCTDINSSIHSHTTCTATKMDSDSESESENKDKKGNLDHKLEDKKSETTTEVNIKCNKISPIINIEELLTHIENLQSSQSKSEVLPKMSGTKDDFISDNSTTAEIKCRKELSSTKIIQENYSECLSNVIENQNSTQDENLSSNIPVLSDSKIIEYSNSEPSVIIPNKQRLLNESSQENEIQQNVIETTLQSEYNDKVQTLVETSNDSHGVDRVSEEKSQDVEQSATNNNVTEEGVSEEKSQDVEQSATNNNVMEEDERISETILVNANAQIDEHRDNVK